MPDSPPLLELDSVSKRYDAPGAAESPWVLKDVSLRVTAGESLAIVGPSGSGKSTLLNIIGTLDRPTSGRVLLDGRDLSAPREAELAALRNREIGFVFQLHHLLPQCTALENVLVPTLVRGRSGSNVTPASCWLSGLASCPPPAAVIHNSAAAPATKMAALQGDAETRAAGLLRRVGLGERMTYRPGQLSGGERQRAAVVRALINRPKLLLADEPTGALDRASADQLGGLLVELNREQGVTLIVVTHSIELASRMGRVLELRSGGLHPV